MLNGRNGMVTCWIGKMLEHLQCIRIYIYIYVYIYIYIRIHIYPAGAGMERVGVNDSLLLGFTSDFVSGDDETCLILVAFSVFLCVLPQRQAIFVKMP